MEDRIKLDLFLRHDYDSLRVQEINDEVYKAESLEINFYFEGTINKKKREQISREWCEILPYLKNVKELGLLHNFGHEILTSVSKMPQLKTLILSRSTKIDSLEPITTLTKLERIYIDSLHQLKTIKPLLSLKNIEYLSIENCYRIEDLELIGSMTNLKGLCLTGDSTAPKRLKMDSLNFLQHLKQLKHLDLSTTSVADKSYHVLLELPELERFDTTADIKPSLVNDIKSKHHKLKAGFFVDWDYSNNKFYPGKQWEIKKGLS